MNRKLPSAHRLVSADILTAAIVAIVVAGGGLAKAAGAPTWVLIAAASIAVVGALIGLLLKVLHVIAGRLDLWARPPVPASRILGDLYELGVVSESPEALQALGEEGSHAPYVVRDIRSASTTAPSGEEPLRSALLEAAAHSEPTLIVMSGRSKAGKTRALLEAVAVTLPAAWFVQPKDAAALAYASRGRAPRRSGSGPWLIWIDDIEPWAKRGEGLNPQTLKAFGGWRRPLLLLCTEGGKGVDLAIAEGAGWQELTKDLLVRARRFWVDADVSQGEAIRLRERFGPDAARRIERDGIGEFMIAAQRLVDRLDNERECLEGQAIVQAAIDCQRAGLLRPLRADWLEALYGLYLPRPPSPEGFKRGLDWATTPLYTKSALLARADEPGPDAYAPYDYIVDFARRARRSIKPAVLDRVIDEYADGESELLSVSAVAYGANDTARAERALRRADDLGGPNAAFNLGLLLAEQGDLQGAEAAYRRADERESPHGANNLGVLLGDRGDRDGAEATLRRADERGSVDGANNLGVLLKDGGDPDSAEAAFRRADERGSPIGAFNFGVMLRERGDLAGAEAAFRRADERGSADGANSLGVLLNDRGHHAEAEAAYRRGDERGDAAAAFNLGLLGCRAG